MAGSILTYIKVSSSMYNLPTYYPAVKREGWLDIFQDKLLWKTKQQFLAFSTRHIKHLTAKEQNNLHDSLIWNFFLIYWRNSSNIEVNPSFPPVRYITMCIYCQFIGTKILYQSNVMHIRTITASFSKYVDVHYCQFRYM